MDIATYGAIVSTIAIFTSGLSLWLHWRKHSQEQADRQPEIFLEEEKREGPVDGWRPLTLTVRNLDRYALNVESITVLWPLAARLAWAAECYKPTDELEVPEAIQPERPRRTVYLDLRLPAGGTQSRVSAARYIHGDTHSVSLVVSSRPASAHSLKVFIRQSSSSTSFKVRNRIINVRMTPLPEPNRTKQIVEK